MQSWTDWLPGSSTGPSPWHVIGTPEPGSRDAAKFLVSQEPGSLGAAVPTRHASPISNLCAAKKPNIVSLEPGCNEQVTKHDPLACNEPGPGRPCSLVSKRTLKDEVGLIRIV